MENVQIRRFKIILLASSLASLVLLLLAAFEENLAGAWRTHQAHYRTLAIERATTDAARAAARAIPVQLQQAFLPELNRIDRCTTCHIGVDDPRLSDAPQPVRTHSGKWLEHHPTETFGCTVCHDGQGRAIGQAAAHGRVPHWLSPLLAGEQVYTSCSRCHYENDPYGAESDLYAEGHAVRPLDQAELTATLPGLDAPNAKAITRGKQLVLRSGCLGCHRYRGRGGSLGPEITHVGDKTAHDYDFTHVEGEHTVAQWLFEHFRDPAAVTPNTLMPDMGVSEAQAHDLTQYMLSLHRKSMPARYTPVPPRRESEPASGAQLYAMFCSACHGPQGRGSTVRERMAAQAVDAPPQLMVPSLNHADTLAVASDGYLRAIIEHGRPGTTMIPWGDSRGGGLRPEEIDRLVAFIRSWEPPRPDETAIAASRGNTTYGRALYRQHCATCHGQDGEGGIGTSLTSPSFLAVASDAFLAETIIEGRPDTAMPAWRQFDAMQISDLLAFLRAQHPIRGDRETVLRLVQQHRADAQDMSASMIGTSVSTRIGRTLYNANCVMCHGASGQGDLGPTLATAEFLSLVGDDYLYEAIAHGRPDTGMPAWHHSSSEDIASLILYIRTWQTVESRRLPTAAIVGDWDTGRFLFTGLCAGCHGEHAEGGVGPQLNNPRFLATVTDAMLWEWIAHGKTGTPMRAFIKGGQGTAELRDSQINDLVAYLRSLERRPRVAVAKRPSGRPELGQIWYATACASCHGQQGQGASGPALANRAFLHAASDGYLMATMALGRDGTEMRPVKDGPQSILALSSDQINDVVAYLRSWETNPPTDAIAHRYVIPWDLSRGQRLYEANCSGCHGVDGKAELTEPGRLSAWAPELNNEGFLAAATDGFLQATIVRGRSGTAMRSFGHGSQGLVDLTSDDIDDIVAYIRRWSGQMDLPITIPAQRGDVAKSETNTGASVAKRDTLARPAPLGMTSLNP